MKMRKLKHLKPLPLRVRYPWFMDIEIGGTNTGRMDLRMPPSPWVPCVAITGSPIVSPVQMDFVAAELRVLALGMDRASAAMKAFARAYGVKP